MNLKKGEIFGPNDDDNKCELFHILSSITVFYSNQFIFSYSTLYAEARSHSMQCHYRMILAISFVSYRLGMLCFDVHHRSSALNTEKSHVQPHCLNDCLPCLYDLRVYRMLSFWFNIILSQECAAGIDLLAWSMPYAIQTETTV